MENPGFLSASDKNSEIKHRLVGKLAGWFLELNNNDFQNSILLVLAVCFFCWVRAKTFRRDFIQAYNNWNHNASAYYCKIG